MVGSQTATTSTLLRCICTTAHARFIVMIAFFFFFLVLHRIECLCFDQFKVLLSQLQVWVIKGTKSARAHGGQWCVSPSSFFFLMLAVAC
jgi:hypothetical protein